MRFRADAICNVCCVNAVWLGSQGRLGGALARAGSAGLGLAPPAEVTGRSPKTRKQERREAALGTDLAQCEIIMYGASVPVRAKAGKVRGLCRLENMKVRCGPNVVLVGFARNVKLQCLRQPELGFHFPPHLVHLGNYPV